jgi:anti-anti-sigma factor
VLSSLKYRSDLLPSVEIEISLISEFILSRVEGLFLCIKTKKGKKILCKIEGALKLVDVSIAGETDLMGLEGMELKFTAHTVSRRKPTLIFLSGAEFMVSLGLRPLLSTAKGLKRHGVKMVLLNPQRPGENVLRTSGFGENIPVVHDYKSD